MPLSNRTAWSLGIAVCTAAIALALYFWPRAEQARTEVQESARSEATLLAAPDAVSASAGSSEPKGASGAGSGAAPKALEEPQKPESEEAFWRELEQLRATDKPAALRYALAGEQWYSDVGKPAEGRRAMIVTLLVETGKMEVARDWTRRFIAQYPDSSYRPLVQGLTGIHPRPGPPPGTRGK